MKFFWIFLFLYGGTGFGQIQTNELKLPHIILAEYDTIIYGNTEVISQSSPIVCGVGISDTLNLNNDNNIELWAEDSKKPRQSDSLILIVDASRKDFHSHQLQNRELIPPPPANVNILDSVYDINKNRYIHVLNRKGDSLIHEAIAINKLKKRTHYKSLPLFIYNLSSKDVLIQKPPFIVGDLYIILEAIDNQGVWRPIEYWEQQRFLCVSDYQDYRLKSKTFMVATFREYSGDHKTKLRVKLKSFDHVYYSNSFSGYINYSQFNIDPVIKDIELRFSDRTVQYRKDKLENSFLDY